jgi:hypothetical protein
MLWTKTSFVYDYSFLKFNKIFISNDLPQELLGKIVMTLAKKKVNLFATDYKHDLSTTRTINETLWHKPNSEA